VAPLYHCMVLLMLIAWGVLMIESLLVAILSFLAPLSFHENLISNALLLAHPLKQNIRPLVDGIVEVLWLHYLPFDLCFFSSFVTTIWCDNLGATFCLLIWCFMHVQSVLRLIITLFMIEWLKMRYRFTSYPSKIN
jgi:hypothetical protein